MADSSSYICPPQSGYYTFWIARGDNCELWLSANDDPATKTRIAHITGTNAWTGIRIWDRYATQKSVSIYLQAGQKYYIEALHKEGIGSDNLAVGWQLPDYSLERPIPGIRLSPFALDGQERIGAEQGAQTNSVALEVYPNPSQGEKLFIQSKAMQLMKKWKYYYTMQWGA